MTEIPEKLKSYVSSQKLWHIIKQPDGYYYEIKCRGIVIDRIQLTPKAVQYCLEIGLIKKGVI